MQKSPLNLLSILRSRQLILNKALLERSFQLLKAYSFCFLSSPLRLLILLSNTLIWMVLSSDCFFSDLICISNAAEVSRAFCNCVSRLEFFLWKNSTIQLIVFTRHAKKILDKNHLVSQIKWLNKFNKLSIRIRSLSPKNICLSCMLLS